MDWTHWVAALPPLGSEMVRAIPSVLSPADVAESGRAEVQDEALKPQVHPTATLRNAPGDSGRKHLKLSFQPCHSESSVSGVPAPDAMPWNLGNERGSRWIVGGKLRMSKVWDSGGPALCSARTLWLFLVRVSVRSQSGRETVNASYGNAE